MTQVQLPKIRRKVLGDQLADRLLALPGVPTVTVYRGQVSAKTRWPQVPGSVDPPLLPNQPAAAGLIAPYVVLFSGVGSDDLEVALSRCDEQLRWTPQTTIAAGTEADCLQSVDRVSAWLRDWQPVLAGVSSGLLIQPPGFDPGPVRPDQNVKPVRWFVPLQWQLDLTT